MTIDALWTATAGLKATQTAIGVVSQNVANSGTAGYVRRTVNSVATGVASSGVATGTITRSFDSAALRQLRLETAGAAYTSTRASITGQLDNLYGTPGSTTALDGTLNSFTESLQELTASPTSAAARSTVLSNASALATRINSAASAVQNLRTGMESQLGTDTASASSLLQNIASLNAKIAGTTDDSTRADLQDQRDQAINSLSSYMDVTTVDQRDGSVTVLTGSGVTLVDRANAATLSFDGRGTLTANSAYSNDPSKRTVGTITATTPGGAKIDLGAPGALRSGSLAAELELRDTTLPQAQRQLDDLAGGLASSLTDTTSTATVSGTGTAATATVDLSGMQAGNTLTIPITLNGKSVNVTLVASNKATTAVDPSLTTDANGFAQTFDLTGAPATLKSNINAALSALSSRLGATGYPSAPALSVTALSGSSVTIGSTASSTAVTGASADATVPTSTDVTKQGYPQLALFVDGAFNTVYTGSLDGGAQLTGFAQRIAVNPGLVANSSSLTNTSATDSTPSGSRAQTLFTALTTTQQTFSSSSGIGGVAAPYSASVAGFAQDIISAQGAAAGTASTLDGSQQVALSTAQSRFSSTAGVNIDQEMSNLIALQTAYGANARVLTAARDMLNQLLQI